MPYEAVDRFKQKKIIQVARVYLAEYHLDEEIPARFDVAAIHLTSSGLEIELIIDAF